MKHSTDTSQMLDLGCGKNKRPGSLGVDVIWNEQIDVVHDLNHYPYPFKDSQFDDVLMDNSIEHLDNIVKTLEELWRICKPDATIKIKVPYFRSHYAIDPTHKHYFASHSLYYFDPRHDFHQRYKYSNIALFHVEEVTFDKDYGYTKLQRLLMSGVRWLANRYPMRYEEYLAPLFPMHCIDFRLRVLK
jgi:SAM-dependent methyltransferase